MHVNVANYELRPFALTHVAGHLDLTSASTFTDALESRLQRGQDLVLDISAVAFVDAVGIVAARALARRVHDSGGRVVICGGSPSVRAALRRSPLDRHLTTCPDIPTALLRLMLGARHDAPAGEPVTLAVAV